MPDELQDTAAYREPDESAVPTDAPEASPANEETPEPPATPQSVEAAKQDVLNTVAAIIGAPTPVNAKKKRGIPPFSEDDFYVCEWAVRRVGAGATTREKLPLLKPMLLYIREKGHCNGITEKTFGPVFAVSTAEVLAYTGWTANIASLRDEYLAHENGLLRDQIAMIQTYQRKIANRAPDKTLNDMLDEFRTTNANVNVQWYFERCKFLARQIRQLEKDEERGRRKAAGEAVPETEECEEVAEEPAEEGPAAAPGEKELRELRERKKHEDTLHTKYPREKVFEVLARMGELMDRCKKEGRDLTQEFVKFCEAEGMEKSYLIPCHHYYVTGGHLKTYKDREEKLRMADLDQSAERFDPTSAGFRNMLARKISSPLTRIDFSEHALGILGRREPKEWMWFARFQETPYELQTRADQERWVHDFCVAWGIEGPEGKELGQLLLIPQKWLTKEQLKRRKQMDSLLVR